MFLHLKQGAHVYILDKSDLTLKIGQIKEDPVPQSRVPGYVIGQYNDTILNIKVTVGNDTLDFQKIPANLSIAHLGNVIICDNQDDADRAICTFAQECQQHVDNHDYYVKAVNACKEMRVKTNPAYAKDRERDSVIDNLKSEMGEIREEFRGAVSEIKNLIQLYAPKQSVANN